MSERADFEHPTHALIQKRWSPRAFADRPVDTATVCSLFEAARWAPSCFNEQPWRFIVGMRGAGDTHDRLASVLADGNRGWASQAPVLVLSVAAAQFARNDNPNRWAQHDTGLAMGQLLMEATARDLYVHQMGGFDADKARQVFGIPGGFEPMAAAAIGYLGDPATLPDELRQREESTRARRALSEMVFGSTWNAGAEWL